MGSFQKKGKIVDWLVVMGIVSCIILDIGLSTATGAPGVNRIFEIILKGSALTLKDQIVAEKEDKLIMQGLMLAIAHNKTEMATILIDNQADVSLRLDEEFAVSAKDKFDPEGETVLHRAARLGQVAIVKQLLAKKAPVNAEDKLGQSPLDAVNALLTESESPDDGKAGGKLGSQTFKIKAPKLKEIAEILEEAGGKSLKDSGMLPIILGVIGVLCVLGGLLFLHLGKAGQLEAAKKAKGPGAGKHAETGDWLSQAATVGGRFARANWVELCMAKTGKRQDGATEEIIQMSDPLTLKYFPKAASFSANFSKGELSLSLAFLVNQPGEIITLPPEPSKKEWQDLPEIKGTTVMIDSEKTAREAFAAYSKLVQLGMKLDEDGESIVGYTIKRDDIGWKCIDPNRVELDAIFDSRGRLEKAKGKRFGAEK